MKDDLGERMKSYERTSQGFLQKKVPVIGRIDGKAFHTLTRTMKKPFDERLMITMVETAEYLMDEIQGARFAYVQSDEISILLTDYDREETQAWFGYNIQKLCSVGSSMATFAFNNAMEGNFDVDWIIRNSSPALFDARWFNLEFDEVQNYFIWRQADAMRNSVNTYAQSIFSHKELQNKSVSEVLEMLEKAQKSWYALSFDKQLGVALYKYKNSETGHLKTVVDMTIPYFKDVRDYINNHVYVRR